MACHWTCPYCDRDTTLQSGNYATDFFQLKIDNAESYRHFDTLLIVCPKSKCKQFTLQLSMFEAVKSYQGFERGTFLRTWNLVPGSEARPMPDYLPQAIRGDYQEACLIRDLSPKASATLARRALQGMIRDFWAIKKARLIDEIVALKDKIDPITWQAIDAVRSVGNIGAHMEKDINVIVDVDPQEAQKLIQLIEILIKDWYVTRHDREERLKAVIEVKEAKDDQKKAKAALPPAEAE